MLFKLEFRLGKSIFGALLDLVPFIPYIHLFILFGTHGVVLLLPILLKVVLHGCFSRFLNGTNGNKSRKALHLEHLTSHYFHYKFFCKETGLNSEYPS